MASALWPASSQVASVLALSAMVMRNVSYG
jgi:hypothetical protein